MWPDTRLIDLLGTEHPIVQAPMAGVMDADLVVAACEGGALGSLPCGMLSPEQVRAAGTSIKSRTNRSFNLNFMCHAPPARDAAREAAWRAKLAPYYRELGVDAADIPMGIRMPFDAAGCDAVLEVAPRVVSFHYGLPDAALVKRIKDAGCVVISSATTVAEARWLEGRGADAIIAQGFEAGGHRGMFLTDDIATQVGTLALVPQVVDAVKVPVIAAGGIADARGIAAAFMLGATGVQMGTAFLRCPESKISALFRAALENAGDASTVLANVYTGRPARGIVNRLVRETGPMSDIAPAFPLAANAVTPLKAKAEAEGSSDFSTMLAGQAAALGRSEPAQELTQRLAKEASALLKATA